MPIYYKKVNPDANDISLIESGLIGTGNGNGSGSPPSSSSPGSFFSGVQKKLTSNFGSGSRSSLFTSGSGGGGASEVELENITTNLQDEDGIDDLHLGGGGGGTNNGHRDDDKHEPFLVKSKAGNEDRDRLMTKFGPIVVVKQFPVGVQQQQQQQQESEDPEAPKPVPRPVIITYHDIGLNYFSNFESFFTRMNIKTLLQDFRIYHVNAPGQEEQADDLPHVGFQFPTMDDLAEQLGEVCRYYNIQEFIGFGYGAGANILARFALSNSDMVEALFLINPSATTSTWMEWFYQKMNVRALTAPATALDQATQAPASATSGSDLSLPQSIQDYFMWHLFGNTSLPDRPLDEEAHLFYQRYLNSGYINRHNLALFIDAYIGRTALGISRDDKLNNFKCNVAVVSGDYSPHVDESVKMNGRLDPTNSTWVKLSDCSMVLEEQPNKVAEVLRLFLQGLGYTLKKAMRLERSFLTGKSMPCLAYYTKQQNEKIAELRRGTTAGINEV